MTTSTDRARDILTPGQAAEYLQVNRETIYRYIRDGRLIAFRLGRAYLIAKTNLDALLWSTSTRPDIRLREFSEEEIAAFEAEDRLAGKAKEVAERIDAFLARQSPTA